jgi:hypothetical protein
MSLLLMLKMFPGVSDSLLSVATFQWRTQEFFSRVGSTNSVEDRGQIERGSGGGSPLVRGFAQFGNE